MAIYLVQHGLSFSKDQDPEQGLTDEGIASVNLIAGVAKNYHVHVSEIWHSGKKRAVMTAELFQQALLPHHGIKEVPGLKPLDDVAPIADALENNDDVMIVGHMPFIQKLISYLVLGTVEPAVFKVQNGGIICLDENTETGRFIIKWALMPTVS